jgi:hypothetical protein
MSDWVARSALSDILKEDFRRLNEDRLYRKYGPAPCASEHAVEFRHRDIKGHLCSGGDLNPILGFYFPPFSRVLPGEFPSG